MSTENLLELRLGGNYESLAARLRRAPPGTTRRIATPPQPEITDLDQTLEPRAATPRDEGPPSTPPRVQPQRSSQPEFRIVTITEGQTLYGVCEAELGSGGRWKEVAALSGLSETQAAHLHPGQKVKLPVR